MDVLKKLFESHFRLPVEFVQPIQGQLGGSGRKIIRLSAEGKRAIGILYDVREENVAFLEFSRHFRCHGLPVPEIYADDLSHGAYLEEDLGDTTLFDFVSSNRAEGELGEPAVDAYRKALTELPRFQVEAGRDLNYKQLEDDFIHLTKFLLSASRDYFMYRDFQSRNIMLRDGTPFFVDYQGGRKGALQYDVASLLFDAKADLPPQLRQLLLDHYLDALSGFLTIDRQAFLRHYYAYVYVRIMQALGAYGFRGFYERKSHFLQSVPFALKNLRWLLHNVELPLALASLMEAFRGMLGSEKLQGLLSEPEHRQSRSSKPDVLTVRVFSFSFHQGLPKDDSGNGGGFVFDGRGLPNPGREERFKQLTGKDAAVAEYLNKQPNVHQFLTSAQSLVDSSVSNYQSRGFKDLMVAFGCTGGQHRSVYMAEQLARTLRERNGLQVVVRHLGLESLGK